MWGKRYREYYGTQINAPTVKLDTLFGGVKPIRKGGGHQSNSLHLLNNDGKRYVMRALRKDGQKYLQAVVFKDQYIMGEFENTKIEGLLNDFFTGSHPYAPFTVGTLSDAVDIFHSNPKLYYVPKQNSLGSFNDEFGDALYMIEERASTDQKELASFGNPKKIINTSELLVELNKSHNTYVHEPTYIRARLFDMLIGDWDRHEDQWSWAEFKDDNSNTYYKPIPRDRDQAFSIMGEGLIMKLIMFLTPSLKLMDSYSDELKNPKWFNLEPFPLDLTLINRSDKKVWHEQAKFIQEHLTDEVIEKAFAQFPKEVQGQTIEEIKTKLKGRRKHLLEISDKYYDLLNKYIILTGTEKQDWIELTRQENGDTRIQMWQMDKKSNKERIYFDRTFNKKLTKQIWIYGLGEKDHFEVNGTGKEYIKTKLIGGKNNDTYDIKNTANVKIYDYKTHENTFIQPSPRYRTDDYEINTFNFKNYRKNTNISAITAGYNPDDGIRLNYSDTYTIYGLVKNPFTAQHRFEVGYYFATKGLAINYRGEFAKTIGNLNFAVSAGYHDTNFTNNFFGLGNETIYDKSTVDMNYNRIRMQEYAIAPSLIWKGELGGKWEFGANYQNINVENTPGRFLTNNSHISNSLFDTKQFLGVDAKYHFENYNSNTFPTLGMETQLETGAKNNLYSHKSFGYLIPSVSLNLPLVASGKLVFATKFKGHIIFGEDYEFYQSANIGGSDGLRGFRNNRFAGKRSYYQNIDLRYVFTRFKTGLMPLQIGMFGGFDYGRVWLPTESSDKWHNSYGGGLFLITAGMMTSNLSIFNSNEGARFSFSLGFKF
ncbi:ShlB/FhaC/HecB family hemolysin secretion/activation protein [Soonwooa sp.]|uniref:ShlB/FhaC/HecB family hemolysin secretion/activation protein n=1 Tax=Soonwooa sp. TaxID=1938592 RepID=UPI0028A08C77|nr:hypothetical protein [Soonwooa sp.]